MSKQYDSDKDISDKIRRLVINSEKQSKQAVTKGAKLYKTTIEANTPVHKRQTHSSHAIETLKISNFKRDEMNPTKEIGFDKGRKRGDARLVYPLSRCRYYNRRYSRTTTTTFYATFTRVS